MFYNSEKFDAELFKYNGIDSTTNVVVNRFETSIPWSVINTIHMDKVTLLDSIWYDTIPVTDNFMRITKSGFLPGLSNEPGRVLFELNLD